MREGNWKWLIAVRVLGEGCLSEAIKVGSVLGVLRTG